MKLNFKIGLFLLFIFSMLPIDSAQASDREPIREVPFRISAHHFVKNTYFPETNPSYLIIYDYSSFDSLFGIAATMSMDRSKLITESKMQNNFVFSILYQGNDIRKFNIDKIFLESNVLNVYYSSEITQEKATWTCNCHITILVE